MDLTMNPPSTEPMAHAAVAAVHSVNAANATPTQPSAVGHPSYSEMITTALTALNEQNGSSKRAVASYIEANFLNLPPNHSALLTHHLKRLRDSGQLLMVKHSYKLAGSAPAGSVSVNGTASDPAASVGPKRRPGRPPKPKSIQAAVPVFGEQQLAVNSAPAVVPGGTQPQNEAVGQLGSVYVAVEPGGGPGMGGKKRGRGRPPKQSGVKRGRGRPSKTSAVQTGVGRGRGRPKKNSAAGVGSVGRSRGRPRKLPNVEGGTAAVSGGIVGDTATDGVVAGGGIAPVTGKRRGRPPKAVGEAKRPKKLATYEPRKQRKIGAKPLGRPRKNASATASQLPENHLLRAYLDLKGKIEYFQSTMKRTVSSLKSELHSETAVAALQELETLAAMDVGTSNVQPQS